RSEQREVGLDVRKIRREHQEAQQENVVERDAWRTDLAPRKRRRLARDPDQARDRRRADGGGYGPRPDLAMELRDDETNARGEEEDADVQEDSNLEPDRDELSAGHAIEERGLLGRQDLVGFQPGDSGDDIRVHVDPPTVRICTARTNRLSRPVPGHAI